jgi:hypothetical protein
MVKKSIALWAVVAVLALAGCTGDGDEPVPSTSVTGPSPTVASTPVAWPEIPDGEGIIKSTTMTDSSTEPGTTVWAKGLILLPEGKSGDVVVSVSWVNSGTSSVYARGVVRVDDVASGVATEWQVEAELPADATDVQTVLGAVLVD